MDIDSELIDEMNDKIDLLEYASQSFEFVRKLNTSFVTNCPRHTDLTPSLSINPEENYFHCFSCGKGGKALQWMMYIEHLKFPQAVEKLSKLTGTEVTHYKQSSAIRTFKDMKKMMSVSRSKEVSRKILDIDKDYNNRYAQLYPQEWIDEGITKEAMDKYNVRVDEKGNRIVYPVYDNDDNLIGVKGRTRYESYKVLGIAKYMNYFKLGKGDYFQGMHEFRRNPSDTIIIFEGVKSCMKAYSMGISNTVAAETSCLSEDQVKVLLNLHVKNVIIAFDSDVDPKKIYDCTRMLRKFCNVYRLVDKNKRLGEKEAPVDRGEEVFRELLNNKYKL